MASNGAPGKGRRVAIVAGLRTPFVKAGGDFRDLSAVELGALLVNELVARGGIPPAEYDSVVFGQVIPSPLVSLVAREVVLRTQLPRDVEAHTVSRACATSIQATTDAAAQIMLGHGDVVLAGGAESLSDAPIFHLRLAPAGAGARHRLARPQRHRQGEGLHQALRPGPGARAAGADRAHHGPQHG
jgi:acetyl-CoA acyltransferase